MQTRPKLTDTESTLAFVVGGGMALLIIAFALAAARGLPTDPSAVNANILPIMVVVGLAMVIGGIAVWLFITRPWLKHDDWSVPQFTGEDHEAEAHGEHAAPVASGHDQPALALAHAGAGEKKMMVAEATPAPAVTPAVSPRTPSVPAKRATGHMDSIVHAGAVESPEPPDDVELNPVTAISTPEVGEAASPAAKTATKAGAVTNDNLTRIEGIGPKIAAALTSAGINTFARLAAHQPEDLEQIVKGAGVRMVGHATSWPKQAQLAAEQKWEELEKYQHELRAGHG